MIYHTRIGAAHDAAYLHLDMHHSLPLATVDEARRQAASRIGVPVYGE